MDVSLDKKLKAFAQISQRKLLSILVKISGKIDFIIDESLIKLLDKIVSGTVLKSHGVDKLYKLEKGEIPFTNTQRVFMVNNDLITVKHVSDKINGEINLKNDGNSYHIILVGRKLQSIVNMLEREGTWSYVSLHYFQWELIKLDTKLLSLEKHSLYRSLFVEEDQSDLPVVARSIWTLCMILGRPQASVIQGKHSQVVDKMLGKMFEDLGTPYKKDSEIGTLILVDRDLDYASSLLTGSTYSCLLDEVFGIKSGIVEIKDAKNKIPGRYLLNDTDEVYSQIKGRHFSDVFPYISEKTKELTVMGEKSRKMEIEEMKDFVKNELSVVTNFKRKLAYHIGACESIISLMGQRYEGLQIAEQNIIANSHRKETITYIEDCLSMNICNKHSILRLICLMSLTQDGISIEELNRLKFQFFHMFGNQYLSIFHRLEKAGLCVEQSTLLPTDVKGAHLADKVVQVVPLPKKKSAFTNLSQKLKLFPKVEDYQLRNPTDPGYVFGGAFIPVICQIVHLICKKEISIEDLPKLLPNCSVKSSINESKNAKTFVVYVVGGVTYAEISAFQLVEKLTHCQILIVSTATINGNTIMKSYFTN